MKRLLHFFTGTGLIYTCTLSVLLVQMVMSANLFHRISNVDLSFRWNGYTVDVFTWLFSIACTFAVEASVLMLIINGQRIAARVYALAAFANTILYFGYWESFLDGSYSEKLPQLIATTLFAATLAGSLPYFSSLFAAGLLAEKKSLAKNTVLAGSVPAKSGKITGRTVGMQLAETASSMPDDSPTIAVSDLNVANGEPVKRPLPEQYQPVTPKGVYTCEQCGREFESSQSLNAHKRSHKRLNGQTIPIE